MPTSSRCLSSTVCNLNRDVEDAIPYCNLNWDVEDAILYNKAPDYGEILQKINKKHPGSCLKMTYGYDIL